MGIFFVCPIFHQPSSSLTESVILGGRLSGNDDSCLG